jgi:hypothetical protein
MATRFSASHVLIQPTPSTPIAQRVTESLLALVLSKYRGDRVTQASTIFVPWRP